MNKGSVTMDDLLETLSTVQKMGDLAGVFDKLPFFPGGLPRELVVDKDHVPRLEAIAGSMTRE